MAAKRSGAPRERAPKREENKNPDADLFAMLVGAPALSEQFSRIGGNLSPARVSAIIQEADQGRPFRLVDLFHELRQKDGHLQSEMQTREVCIGSIPFDIAPPGEEPLKRDFKYARQCRLALQRCKSLTTAITHWVGEGNVFGHADVEVVWKIETEGELAGLMVPDKFVPISCRRFGFRQSDGELLFDPTNQGNVDQFGVDLLRDFPVGKFIRYQPRVNGDVLVREGLVRCLVWLALFRNFDIRDWLQLAEMAWKPKRLAKYKKDTVSKQDRAQLLSILERLTSTGVAIYPDSVEIDLQWPQQSARQSNHRELAEFLAKEISKAVLGTSDMTEQSTTNGARAAVEKRGELRDELKEWDVVGVANLVTDNVVKQFYRYNYPANIEAGSYVPLIDEPTDLDKFSVAMERLTKRGLKVGAGWVRKKIGAAEPKKGEELLSTDDGSPKDPAGTGKPGEPKPKPEADPGADTKAA
jgi:phage gp29-like protein